MQNSVLEELAFLASLNDIQSLKKFDYVHNFNSEVFLHDLYLKIFTQNTQINQQHEYSFKPLLDKSHDIEEKNLLEYYIEIIKEYQKKKIHIIPYYDEKYPQKLKRIYNPPFLLYLKGNTDSISKPAIGVVGTRNISSRGIDAIQDIVDICVKKGFVIVSGLALGSDTYAHKSTMSCGGETVAVLPGALDNIVPTENKNLAEKIVSSGALVSEITSLAKMHKGRYIERNRITSALSKGVIVIETGETGGSIRQAETAFKEGIPVYTIKPEMENSRTMAGYKKLLSMGAKSIEFPDEIIPLITKSDKSSSKMTTLAKFL
jgi:DNA processing protein